jgi:hypothetical protein
MKLLRYISPIACMAFMLAAAGAANATPIVANGTFASGLTDWTAGGTGTTPGIGVTAINLGPNATPYGDNIPYIDGTSTGAYFVDDNAVESLTQGITLAADTTYDLTFDLFPTLSGAGNEFNFLLMDSVGAIASSSFGNADLTAGVWTPETLVFTTGAANNYNLVFNYTSGPTPAKDVVLTNVGISAVPEPSSFILLGSGLLAAAGVVRRRLAA